MTGRQCGVIVCHGCAWNQTNIDGRVCSGHSVAAVPIPQRLGGSGRTGSQRGAAAVTAVTAAGAWEQNTGSSPDLETSQWLWDPVGLIRRVVGKLRSEHHKQFNQSVQLQNPELETITFVTDKIAVMDQS